MMLCYWKLGTPLQEAERPCRGSEALGGCGGSTGGQTACLAGTLGGGTAGERGQGKIGCCPAALLNKKRLYPICKQRADPVAPRPPTPPSKSPTLLRISSSPLHPKRLLPSTMPTAGPPASCPAPCTMLYPSRHQRQGRDAAEGRPYSWQEVVTDMKEAVVT